MKKTLLISFFVVIVFAAFYFLSKKEGEREKGKEENEAALPPTKQPPENATPLSSGSGQGLELVTQRAREIINSTKGAEMRKTYKIGSGIFSGLSSQRIAEKFKAIALTGKVSETDLQIFPELVSPEFADKANALMDATNGTDKEIYARLKASGESGWSDKVRLLTDFTGISNFKLVDKIGNFIDNGSGYGEANGRDSEIKKINNHVKLAKDLNIIARNLIKESKRFGQLVNDMAITDLRAAGWKIV